MYVWYSISTTYISMAKIDQTCFVSRFSAIDFYYNNKNGIKYRRWVILHIECVISFRSDLYIITSTKSKCNTQITHVIT